MSTNILWMWLLTVVSNHRVIFLPISTSLIITRTVTINVNTSIRSLQEPTEKSFIRVNGGLYQPLLDTSKLDDIVRCIVAFSSASSFLKSDRLESPRNKSFMHDLIAQLCIFAWCSIHLFDSLLARLYLCCWSVYPRGLINFYLRLLTPIEVLEGVNVPQFLPERPLTAMDIMVRIRWNETHIRTSFC